MVENTAHRPLPDQIRDATERLRGVHAERLGLWCDLFVALGRAMQAAQSGDLARARELLSEVEAREYELVGCCDTIGSVIEALDAQAPPAAADR